MVSMFYRRVFLELILALIFVIISNKLCKCAGIILTYAEVFVCNNPNYNGYF